MSTELPETNNQVPTSVLATIRRLYFYLIATISLLVGLSGLLSLLEVLSEVWLGDVGVAVNTASYVREVVARSGGMLLVATPIFLIHWRYIQRLNTVPTEANSGIRKFFLYLISAITLGWGAALTGELLEGVTGLLLGIPIAESDIWPGRWLFLLLGILINGALFIYFQRQLHADGDWGQEKGWAGTWRRLYLAVVGLVSLSLFITGFGVLLETVLQAILPGSDRDVGEYWARGRLSMSFSILVIGAFVWRFNWRNWQQIIEADPADGKTALRRVYLYGSVIISAIATLVPATVLLRVVLIYLFGASNTNQSTGDLATPLAFLPIGFVLWQWHWRLIQKEAASYGDTPESASVRRIYYYTVAAIGLILTWFGLVEILRVLLDLFTSFKTVIGGSFLAEQLATGLSLLAVGVPVWAFHWRTVQSVARRPDAVGEAERSSWPRRLYLYGVALVGALIILYYLTTVVYRILLMLLGEPNTNLFGAETVDALARSSITLVFWLVAVLAIRQDGRLGVEGDEVSESDGDSVDVPTIDTATRKAQLESQIQQLEAELAAVQARLAELKEAE